METVALTLKSLVGEAGVLAWDTLATTQQAPILKALTPGNPVVYWVCPNTQEELSDVMACAHQNRWRVLPCGSGSKLHWGGLATGVNLIISTARLERLIDHAIGDLTVTAEAGFRFADLQALLAKAGQFLAIDPSYSDQATLGGIVSTADTGSLRQRYHSVRDMLLGISFVRSDGQLVKAGGRVVKNVAGYDLMKLLTGSYGTLGIITQVTLRVYPIAEASQTVVLSGEAPAIAQAIQILLGSALAPTAIDLLSSQAVTNLKLGTGIGLLVRFQSMTESVKQQASRWVEVGVKLGLSTALYSESDEENLWRRSRELLSQTCTDATPSEEVIACKIGVKPSEAISVLSQIEQMTPRAILVIHAGSGLGWLVLESSVTRSTQILEMRSICQAAGGYLTVLQAPIRMKQQIDVWGYSGNALELMRTIKQQFDPETLLSPHRFIGNI